MKKYATRKNSNRPPSKGGKGDDSKSKSKLYIIVSVVSTLLYFLFMNSPTPLPPRKVEAPAKATREIVKPADIVIQDQTAPSPSPMNLQKARSGGLRDLVYGVKGIELKEENGVVKIPFSFRSKKQWCLGGDLDTISLVVPDENLDELIVSIETLTSKQRGDKAKVSLHKLVDGFDKTFQLSIRNKTESLGLFICRDSAGTNSCRGKELKSHKEISNSIANNETAPEALKKDYIFYYQNFIVKDGQLYTYKNENTNIGELKKLKEHLQSTYDLKAQDFDESTRFNNVMRSIPAQIKGNKIELTLPYNDPRCLPGGGIPKPGDRDPGGGGFPGDATKGPGN